MSNLSAGEELVSIVTPAYNCANYIAETIESVLRQTYVNWEMVIVDDCSSDNTINTIKQYEAIDTRIRLIQLSVNQGVANARNVAMQYAKGRYLAFLDSDDIWLETKLEEQIDFMKYHDVAFSYTQYRQFVNNINNYKSIIDVPESVDYHSLLKGNVIGCLTVILDRKKIPDFIMLRERHEDYIAWLRILKKGHKAYGLKKDLARYRISDISISGNKKNSIRWTWNVYYKVENLSFLKSVYYFIHYLVKAIKKHY